MQVSCFHPLIGVEFSGIEKAGFRPLVRLRSEYPIVWCPKYRYRVLAGKIKERAELS
jgi:hypothetical protein